MTDTTTRPHGASPADASAAPDALDAPTADAPLQPFLAGQAVALRAPAQAWSADDGAMGASPVHGVYLGDVRLVRSLVATVHGHCSFAVTGSWAAMGQTDVEAVALARVRESLAAARA